MPGSAVDKKISVIISTYNNPQSLRMCLLGMLVQTHRPDQIIIADDGSADETASLLREPSFAGLPLEQVWHADIGWRKCRILNLAISHATGDYLIFCDGDTIPRADFVSSHLRHATARTFLSGSCINVPQVVHRDFTDTEIVENRVFSPEHLSRSWPEANKHRLKLRPGVLEPSLNLLSWRYCVLRGANFSAWRKDLVRVNGFHEHFVYGSEDRELGVRLRNSGVASRWLKFSLVQLHLDHSRAGYLDHQIANRQRWEFRKLFFTGKRRAEAGLAETRERGDTEVGGPYRHSFINPTAAQQASPQTLASQFGNPIPTVAELRKAA